MKEKFAQFLQMSSSEAKVDDVCVGETTHREEIKELSIDDVSPNPFQPRRIFDPSQLEDLAQSIRQYGVLQPVIVRQVNGRYELVSGERRYRASCLAGAQTIPALVRDLNDKEVAEMALIENLQREDLNPMEEAEGYEVLMKDYNMTQEEVAQRMGKSRPAIANALRLLALPQGVRPLVEDGLLSAGHARAILAVKGGEEVQLAFAELLVKNGLSVRQAEERAKTFVLVPPEKPAKAPDPNQIYIREVEESLSSRFGRKVSIHSGKKKGKLELEFYNVDDLNALLDLLATLPSRKEGQG